MTAECAQQHVLEDFNEFGIDLDTYNPLTVTGRHHKARDKQGAIIRTLMGPYGCNWSKATPLDAAEASICTDDFNIIERSAGEWKDEIKKLRLGIIDSRQSQDTPTLKKKQVKNDRYVDQVEMLYRRHLVRLQHDESDQTIIGDVRCEYELNSEQDRAFRVVTQHAANPMAEQLKMYVGSMGGTGKTQVLNALIAYFKTKGESYRLIVVAPTGTAAALVKGSTYHFMFGINECNGDSISKKTMAEVKERLEGVEYVFLDEVSMLSCVDMYRISARLAMCMNQPHLLGLRTVAV